MRSKNIRYKNNLKINSLYLYTNNNQLSNIMVAKATFTTATKVIKY